jgi:hypothetical protein
MLRFTQTINPLNKDNLLSRRHRNQSQHALNICQLGKASRAPLQQTKNSERRAKASTTQQPEVFANRTPAQLLCVLPHTSKKLKLKVIIKKKPRCAPQQTESFLAPRKPIPKEHPKG